MSLLNTGRKFIEDKFKEREELAKIKQDAYKAEYREAVKSVAKEKAREDAEANKYSMREKIKHGLLDKLNEKKKNKKKSVLYDDDGDNSALSPAFKKAFE